jgi:hypothetical protein
MPSNFPTSLDTWSDKIDGTHDVLAAYVNDLAAFAIAAETRLGIAGSTQGAANIEGRLKEVEARGGGDRGTSTASAASLTLPSDGWIIPITGTTTVTGIVASGWTDKVAILVVAGACQFTDNGGTLNLEGNFTGPGALVLECDGTNWQEIARSNPSVALADGSVTQAKLAADSVTSAKIVDGTILAADISSAIKDGPAADPSLRSLGTGSQQAAAGSHTHAGVTGVDVKDEGGTAANATTFNFVGAGVSASVAGSVATVTIAGAATPDFADLMTWGVD